MEVQRKIVQTTIDNSIEYDSYIKYEEASVEDIRILAEVHEKKENIKLTALQISILYGVIPSNPAIYGSRENEGEEGIRWTLPGRGERSRWDGKWLSKEKVNACPKCGNVMHYQHNCDKLTCPTCCWNAMGKRSMNAMRRIMCGRDLFHGESWDKDRSLQHVVISPPKNEWHKMYSEEGYTELRKHANNIATEIGLVGGLCVFHPFRRNGVDDDKIEEGYIADIENNMNPLYWREGPHFHFIGYGFVQQCGNDWIDHHKGWLFKSIRTGKDKLTTNKSVSSAVRYIISHVGIMEGSESRKQTMSYFGELNTKNLNEKCRIVATRPEKCNGCGEILRSLEVNSIDRTVKDVGIAYEKRTYPIFGKPSEREQIESTIMHYKKHGTITGLIRDTEISMSRCAISTISSNLTKELIQDGWLLRIIPNFKIRKSTST